MTNSLQKFFRKSPTDESISQQKGNFSGIGTSENLPLLSTEFALSPVKSKHFRVDISSKQTQYKNYIKTELPSVNEIDIKSSEKRKTAFFPGAENNESSQPVSLNIESLLIQLFKKILVYSSKIDSLQVQPRAPTPTTLESTNCVDQP